MQHANSRFSARPRCLASRIAARSFLESRSFKHLSIQHHTSLGSQRYTRQVCGRSTESSVGKTEGHTETPPMVVKSHVTLVYPATEHSDQVDHRQQTGFPRPVAEFNTCYTLVRASVGTSTGRTLTSMFPNSQRSVCMSFCKITEFFIFIQQFLELCKSVTKTKPDHYTPCSIG